MNFGEKLKALRLNAHMSQAELAKRAHVTKSTISYYELLERAPSPDVLIRLADIFHVTTDYLLGIQNRKFIDVTDLSDEDMQFLLLTIDTLRRKNQGK